MPLLNYLADTNAVSDYFRSERVRDWFDTRKNQVGISAITIAEMRRGIELKPDSKARRKLEKLFRFSMEDYRDAVFVFDEAAAVEWGRMMVEHPALDYDDSQIAAIARSCEMIVVTRNGKHFPGCNTVNPWTD